MTEKGIVDSLLEAKVECPCELLKNADVRLESLGEDKDVRKWEDAFWRTDRWCLALSATKLLNDAEKEFCTRISEYYNEEDYSFYLGDLEQILTEEDKRHIEGSMDAFAGQFPDGIRVGYQADEKIIENTGELDRFSDIEYVEMQSSLALFRDGVQKKPASGAGDYQHYHCKHVYGRGGNCRGASCGGDTYSGKFRKTQRPDFRQYSG